MLRRWVLTISGFSLGGASFLAFLNFLTSAIGFRFSPRRKRRRARECINSINCSLEIKFNTLILQTCSQITAATYW